MNLADPLVLSGIAFGLIVLIIVISIILKNESEFTKVLLFGSICFIAISFTIYLSGTTIHKNVTSVTKGPVHWHADFQILKCGQPVKLKSPSGLSNSIGIPLLHEHGDRRIHVEGAVKDLSDVSLGNFFKAIGGSLELDSLTVPTDQGQEVLASGDTCNGQPASLQVFVYKVTNQLMEQEKLQNPKDFILVPSTTVPEGNCIIIELDIEKERTDKLCESYDAAKETGKIYGK